MNEYELLYVISPRLTAEEVDAAVARVQGLIETGGGSVLMSDNWGRRRLAYPIKHHFEGTYVLTHLTLPPERTAEFERALFISEEILRHLLIRGIVPDYHGPPDQELVDSRRGAPRPSMRRFDDDEDDEGSGDDRGGSDDDGSDDDSSDAEEPAEAPSAAEPSPATASAE